MTAKPRDTGEEELKKTSLPLRLRRSLRRSPGEGGRSEKEKKRKIRARARLWPVSCRGSRSPTRSSKAGSPRACRARACARARVRLLVRARACLHACARGGMPLQSAGAVLSDDVHEPAELEAHEMPENDEGVAAVEALHACIGIADGVPNTRVQTCWYSKRPPRRELSDTCPSHVCTRVCTHVYTHVYTHVRQIGGP